MRRRINDGLSNEKLSNVIHELGGAIEVAGNSAADNVVTAAVAFVLGEGMGNEEHSQEQLENAVYAFVDVKALFPFLGDLRRAGRTPAEDKGVIDLDPKSEVKQAEIPHETFTDEVLEAMLSPEYSGIVEVTPSGERPIMKKELKARAQAAQR